MDYERCKRIVSMQAYNGQSCLGLPPQVKTGASLAKTALVFNCQMGRGRTTTGMVRAEDSASVTCNQ